MHPLHHDGCTDVVTILLPKGPLPLISILIPLARNSTTFLIKENLPLFLWKNYHHHLKAPHYLLQPQLVQPLEIGLGVVMMLAKGLDIGGQTLEATLEEHSPCHYNQNQNMVYITRNKTIIFDWSL